MQLDTQCCYSFQCRHQKVWIADNFVNSPIHHQINEILLQLSDESMAVWNTFWLLVIVLLWCTDPTFMHFAILSVVLFWCLPFISVSKISFFLCTLWQLIFARWSLIDTVLHRAQICSLRGLLLWLKWRQNQCALISLILITLITRYLFQGPFSPNALMLYFMLWYQVCSCVMITAQIPKAIQLKSIS